VQHLRVGKDQFRFSLPDRRAKVLWNAPVVLCDSRADTPTKVDSREESLVNGSARKVIRARGQGKCFERLELIIDQGIEWRQVQRRRGLARRRMGDVVQPRDLKAKRFS